MSNQKFLKKLASDMMMEYNGDPDSLIVVVPSRRAALYLKKEIIEIIEQPVFAPTIIPIGDFIQQFSSVEFADEISLLINLYEVYKSVIPDKYQDFYSFFPSGQLLIKDFNDIDDNLIDGTQLFNNLSDIKEIEGWEPGIIDSSSHSSYLEFFKKLSEIYTQYRLALIEKGIGYSGLVSSLLYENKEKAFEGKYAESKFIVAGLNALSPSESGIFDYLYRKGQLQFVWDCDGWYMDDPNHEAGLYLRANKKNWPNTFKEVSHQLTSAQKSIQFIGAPHRYEQIQTALECMKRIPENEWSDSALILADESLAPIFMESVSDTMESSINISLGYPLSQTIASSWIDDWITMQEFMVRTSRSEEYNNTPMLSRRHMIQLLSNPMSQFIVENDQEKSDKLRQCLVFLRKSAQYYYHHQTQNEQDIKVINNKSICNIINHIIPGLLIPVKRFNDATQRLYDLYWPFAESQNKDEDIEQVACAEICRILAGLIQIDIPDSDNQDNQLKLLKLLLKNFIKQTRIRLHGEPVKGLQVLGMLETRALDFKNIIVVGANEGILPAGKSQQSFIPYDLRKQNGLPTFEKNDAVFAYHFYRLLQSPSQIDIIYNTEADPLSGKEPSRFLHQIDHLLRKSNQNIQFDHLICKVALPTFNRIENAIIKKDEYIKERLHQIASKGLSFSAFYNYVSCPLKFYYSNILRIKEVDDFGDILKINQLGTLVHKVIETIYSDVCNSGKLPDKSLLITMKSKVESEFNNQANILHEGIDFNEGENYLLKRVITDSIKRLINGQIEQLSKGEVIPEIIEMEKSHSCKIVLDNSKEISLYGQIDRIEKREGTHYIMDFKTNNKVLNGIKIPLDSEFSEKIGTLDQYALQLIYYSFIYFNENEDINQVMAGLYPLLRQENHHPEILFQKTKGQETNEIIFTEELSKTVERTIINLLNPLFDDELPIIPTPSNDSCVYCVYKDKVCFASNQIPESE